MFQCFLKDAWCRGYECRLNCIKLNVLYLELVSCLFTFAVHPVMFSTAVIYAHLLQIRSKLSAYHTAEDSLHINIPRKISNCSV